MRFTRPLLTALPLAAVAIAGLGMPTASASDIVSPTGSYAMTGVDEGAKFEGIGVDQRRGAYYVSEVTGGEIHRGTPRAGESREWLDGNGTDGRWTARGITTDRHGNIYVAGGPNGIDHPGAPDLWVYSPEGTLLTALRAPGEDTFLNDVTIGPDGAAYFTDTHDPRIIRVAPGADGWSAEVFADGTGTVQRKEGFNLGGIVVSADRTALVVAQGNTGALWRVDLRSRAFTPVTGAGTLTDADGLVREGDRLSVIRNFQRRLTTVRMSPDGRHATQLSDRATDADRVFTTGKVLRGELLVVDSRFEEQAPAGDHAVLVLPRH